MKILAISGSLRKESLNTQLLKAVGGFVDENTSIELFDLAGGVRAQVHLRDILAATLTPVYLAPDFALASAHKAFDDEGRLVDENTRNFLQKYVTGYTGWVASQRAR